jgi:hypothetical protein
LASDSVLAVLSDEIGFHGRFRAQGTKAAGRQPAF